MAARLALASGRLPASSTPYRSKLVCLRFSSAAAELPGSVVPYFSKFLARVSSTVHCVEQHRGGSVNALRLTNTGAPQTGHGRK